MGNCISDCIHNQNIKRLEQELDKALHDNEKLRMCLEDTKNKAVIMRQLMDDVINNI
jgi:CHASE3 domain sensor protein